MESSDLPAIPYNLKHFHRGPLRFSGLSQRLKLRIVKMHPASTQLKLVEASFSVSILVEIVHSESPRVNMAKNFLESFPKNDLLHPNQATDCFSVNKKIIFYDWARECLLRITSGPHAEGRGFKEYNQQPPYLYKNECQWSLDALWDSYQRMGPAWFNWTYLPRNMKQEILLKTSLAAASRLACTSVIGREAVLTCVKSVRLLEIRDETWPSNHYPKIPGRRHIYYYVELWAAPFCFTYKDANSRPTADTKALHDATKRRDLRQKKFNEKRAKFTKEREPLGYTKIIRTSFF